jgi:4-oxalocrotonate tautomerase
MPVVTVDWVTGRSADQKRDIAARITAAVAEVGNVDPGSVWVIFNDVARDDWAIGGRLASDG